MKTKILVTITVIILGVFGYFYTVNFYSDYVVISPEESYNVDGLSYLNVDGVGLRVSGAGYKTSYFKLSDLVEYEFETSMHIVSIKDLGTDFRLTSCLKGK